MSSPIFVFVHGNVSERDGILLLLYSIVMFGLIYETDESTCSSMKIWENVISHRLRDYLGDWSWKGMCDHSNSKQIKWSALKWIKSYLNMISLIAVEERKKKAWLD